MVLDQGIDLKSSAKFTNAPDLARHRGPYHFATWSDAVDAVKKRPSAPAASLPAPNSPSCRATCCLLQPQIVHFPMHLCARLTRLCLCLTEEREEEVCLSLRLCACLWRRDRACFNGVDGARWLGVQDEARGW